MVKHLELVDQQGNRLVPIDSVYPIGAIYMSVVNIDPSTLFGGLWERFGIGRTLVSVDENDSDFNFPEKVGGGKQHSHVNPVIGNTSVDHTHTLNNHIHTMSSHHHVIEAHFHNLDSNGIACLWVGGAGTAGFGARHGGNASWTDNRVPTGTNTSNSNVVRSGGIVLTGRTAGLQTAANTGINNSATAAPNTPNTGNQSVTHNHSLAATNNSSSLQPFITCYMFKRIA